MTPGWRPGTPCRRSGPAVWQPGWGLPLALEELGDCVPAADDPSRAVEELVLKEVLNRFLGSLPAESRKIFLQRYWYFRSVKEIAEDLSVTQSKVKMCLLRARADLRQLLEKEGFSL